jgi:hypothetical protein
LTVRESKTGVPAAHGAGLERNVLCRRSVLAAEDHLHRLTGNPNEPNLLLLWLTSEYLESPRQKLNRFLDGTPEANGLIRWLQLFIELVWRELFVVADFVSAHDWLDADYLFRARGWSHRDDRHRLVQPTSKRDQ